MTSFTLKEGHDTVLPIVCNELTESGPGSMVSCAINTIHKLTLTLVRRDAHLVVNVHIAKEVCQKCNDGKYIIPYESMHIVSHRNSMRPFRSVYMKANEFYKDGVKVSFPVNSVLYKGQYRFDIVLSTETSRLSRLMMGDLKYPQALSKHREIMLTLLRDTNTLDTCFTFKSDKVSSDVELWAHRSILCRYKPFVDIIKRVPKPTKLSWIKDTNDMRTTEETLYSTCSTETNENFDNNPSDFAVVVVQKFSAATICAMLLYIYTGEVNLAVDTGKFAISKGNSCLRVSSSQGQYAKAIAPHSLESDVVWGFKDATWAELLAAAEEYGVADLKERCEREICDDINESNAFELLFKVGTRFEEVKNSVIAYIVFNMDSMFPKDSDPFAPYKDHPSCHDMMLEVMRQRAEYDP